MKKIYILLLLATILIGTSYADLQDDADLQDYADLQDERDAYSEGDYKIAFYALAEQGNNYVQLFLGQEYEHNQNYNKSVYWYTKSAEQGNKQAQNRLATLYAIGLGTNQDDSKAIYWRKKNPNVYKFSTLPGAIEEEIASFIFFKSIDSIEWPMSASIRDIHRKAGVRWYKKSAELGNGKAQKWLATRYWYGDSGLPEDYVLAYMWANIVASKGIAHEVFPDVKKFKNTLKKVMTPNQISRAQELSRNWEQKVATVQIPPNAYASGSGWLCNSGYIKKGNMCVIKKISKTLQDGDNAYDKKDYKTALSIYRSLAEQGNAKAQFYLALMYSDGEGVIKSIKEAVKWYTKAAEQGNAKAQYSLGLAYTKNEGISIDYKKALSWWSKSAKQGNHHSEYALGWLYENGHGVKQDTKKALSWYLKADAKGNSQAKERIEELLLPKDDTPAIVDGNSTEGFTFTGSGSGFVVSEDGVIATNNHVIDGCQKLIVDDLKATVISKDVNNDLALLQVNNIYKYVSVLTYKSPSLGDNINVFGYPLSDMFSDEHISLTKGSVSSLAGFEGDLSNFRFTAPVQPGNSGGPIVNEEGKVVGITMSVLGTKVIDELKFLPQNVNLGIRSNILINMMESKLIDGIFEPITKSDLIDHYSKATKFIKCYE